jgi:Flp pilus assembly protein TadG
MTCLIGRGKHTGRFPQPRKRDKGAELAEFAVVFPLFLVLLFAPIWCGRALSISGRMCAGTYTIKVIVMYENNQIASISKTVLVR